MTAGISIVKEEKEEKATTPVEATETATPVAATETAAPVKEEVKAEKKSEKEILDFATPTETFDWEADEANFGEYTKDEVVKMQDLYSDTVTTPNKGDIVKGIVVSVGDKDVVLNIGFKSDGMVPTNEFRDTPDLKAGDEVEVLVEEQEDKLGQLVLSRKRAKIQRSWDNINTALEEDKIINGFVKSRTKGGLIVDVNGVEAFLPGSQIDIKPIRDYDAYVGKTMEFKVVKINHEFKNVVVSHKILIEDDLESQKQEIMAKLEKGQVLEGTVKNITDFGVFIDLGGVDGLLHITDISWGRIDHPSEILELDQKINVVVLDFDDEKRRIALGLKQLTEHPWEALSKDIEIGTSVTGKVVNIADYGAFIEIAPGVEGLIHVSEMSWSQHLRTPEEFMKLNDEVEAVVLTIDREDRKMSLGIKQMKTDPWETIEGKYPVGSSHTAKVRNMTNFGVFVEIEEGVDGLIHISDLSWTKKINHPKEFTEMGAELQVSILEIDLENRRLSLGHKQLEENPWDTFETVFYVNSVHEGTITKITDKGAIISLPYGVEGFSPIKHIVKDNNEKMKIDEKGDFKVIEFNKESKRILISHSRIHQDDLAMVVEAEKGEKKKTAAAAKKSVKKVKDSVEKTTLGDLDVLSALKSSLETSEKKDVKPAAKKAAKKDDAADSEAKED